MSAWSLGKISSVVLPIISSFGRAEEFLAGTVDENILAGLGVLHDQHFRNILDHGAQHVAGAFQLRWPLR